MKKIISIALLLLLSACSTLQTGFFSSYEGMKKLDENFYFSKVDDANLSAYDKVFIPEVKLMTNRGKLTPAQHQLNIELKAYATRGYRRTINQKKLVNVGQKNTLVIQIALSLAHIDKTKKGLDAVEFLPLSADDTSKELHLVIEVQSVDIMTSKVLSRSVRIIMNEDVNVKELSFKDVQPSLDAWLKDVVKH